jgi:hypothetical protein
MAGASSKSVGFESRVTKLTTESGFSSHQRLQAPHTQVPLVVGAVTAGQSGQPRLSCVWGEYEHGKGLVEERRGW